MGHENLFEKRKARLERKTKMRDIRKILIVCEGKKTEPGYFRCFAAKPEVEGLGFNTVSLVKEACRLREKRARNGIKYIETWCVFDRDSFPTQLYHNAILLAEKEHILCAFSNESFELWYLLHFEYCDAQLGRSQYETKLTGYLNQKYRKNDPDMFAKLKSRQAKAIKNAKRLYDSQKHLPDFRKNPVTTVFRLVERLNEAS